MRFTWDPAKDQANQRKHAGISFDLASEVFYDPSVVLVEDRMAKGEQRWHAIGMAAGEVLLLVVHTYKSEPEELIRLISARKVTSYERRVYADGI